MSDVHWRKSSFSGAGNDCVEVRNDLVGIRDSKSDDKHGISVGKTGVRALILALVAGALPFMILASCGESSLSASPAGHCGNRVVRVVDC